jgi:hypothetical protein
MLPIKIYTRKKIFNYYTGLSFFIFIWICKLTRDEVKLVRHEKIHFLQQVEMLFLFHWIFYAYFYLVARYKGHGHYIAYRYNPFEIEAYNNESDTHYLKTRKPFAWVSCIRENHRSLERTVVAKPGSISVLSGILSFGSRGRTTKKSKS